MISRVFVSAYVTTLFMIPVLAVLFFADSLDATPLLGLGMFLYVFFVAHPKMEKEEIEKRQARERVDEIKQKEMEATFEKEKIEFDKKLEAMELKVKVDAREAATREVLAGKIEHIRYFALEIDGTEYFGDFWKKIIKTNEREYIYFLPDEHDSEWRWSEATSRDAELIPEPIKSMLIEKTAEFEARLEKQKGWLSPTELSFIEKYALDSVYSSYELKDLYRSYDYYHKRSG